MDFSKIDYEALLQSALKGVIKSALEQAAQEGLPGEHHFYVGFLTKHPGTSISPKLLAQYPEQMIIVLQHQYDELKIEDERFTVMLTFGGANERLVVPFDAIFRFEDPSVNFALQFEPEGYEALHDPALADEDQLSAGDNVHSLHREASLDLSSPASGPKSGPKSSSDGNTKNSGAKNKGVIEDDELSALEESIAEEIEDALESGYQQPDDQSDDAENDSGESNVVSLDSFRNTNG